MLKHAIVASCLRMDDSVNLETVIRKHHKDPIIQITWRIYYDDSDPNYTMFKTPVPDGQEAVAWLQICTMTFDFVGDDKELMEAIMCVKSVVQCFVKEDTDVYSS